MSERGPLAVLDIGGTKIAGALARVEGGRVALTHPIRRDTPASAGGGRVLETAIEAATELADAAREQGTPIAGCGISSAGVIDPDTGAVTYASDLMPGWGGQNLTQAVEASLGVPTAALNDVHAHALGESRCGVGREARRMLLVAAGTGLGGALVTSGRVDQGALGVAGSIAHLAHPLAAGMRCACGATTGHIESVASGTGQAALYNRDLPRGAAPASGGGDVYQRACAGEARAESALAASARALGQALASAAALLDPDLIVVTGSASRSGEAWWEALRDGYRTDALPLLRAVPILEGTLGGDAALAGAAIAAHAHIKRDTTDVDNS